MYFAKFYFKAVECNHFNGLKKKRGEKEKGRNNLGALQWTRYTSPACSSQRHLRKRSDRIMLLSRKFWTSWFSRCIWHKYSSRFPSNLLTFEVFAEVKCPSLKRADSAVSVAGDAGSWATFLPGNLAWSPARQGLAAPAKRCAQCSSRAASDPCRWAPLGHSSRAEPLQGY